MNIRFAETQDLEALVGIYNQAIAAGRKTADITPFLTEDRRQWFEDHKPDAYPILIADCGDSIAGYLSISPYRPGRMALRYTAEVSCYVHFDHHGQGVGSFLLQHAIGMSPSLQIKTFIAILIDSNTASVKLLEKYGFKKWGQMPRVAEFAGIEVGHLYYGLRIGER